MTGKRHERVERGIYRLTSGKGYEYNWADFGGTTRWATTRTLTEARQGRAAKIAAVARGERLAPTKVTVRELAEAWFEGKKSRLRKRTAANYRSALDLALLPRFGSSRIHAVDADAIAKLIRDLEREGLHAIDATWPVRPLSPSTITNYLKPLRGTLDLAARRSLIPANPFGVLTSDDRPAAREKQPIHEWTDEDVTRLIEAARSLAARPQARFDYVPILQVISRLGLREGEALGLLWRHFVKDPGFLYVMEQWTRSYEYGPTKTPAGVRRIALPPDLREELIAHRLKSRFSRDEDPIFASRQGTPLTHRTVGRRAFAPARDLGGLPSHLTLHDLRHAAASRLIRGGLDPVTVADVLGHEDATTTLKVYAHLFDRRRTDEAVRAALAGNG